MSDNHLSFKYSCWSHVILSMFAPLNIHLDLQQIFKCNTYQVIIFYLASMIEV